MDGANLQFVERTVEIKRVSEERQEVYGEVAVPLERFTPGQVISESDLEGRVHYDGGCWTSEDIQEMAHNFLAYSRKIDQEHDHVGGMGVPIESFIAQRGWDPWTEGAWVLGVRCTDESWAKVKSGEYRGFSVFMACEKEQVDVFVEDQGGE